MGGRRVLFTDAGERVKITVHRKFKLGGRLLEAAFLEEPKVRLMVGEELIRLMDVNGKVVRAENDWAHLWEYREGLPVDFRSYQPQTARRDPVFRDQEDVSYLEYNRQAWDRRWYASRCNLYDRWPNPNGILVLRFRD